MQVDGEHCKEDHHRWLKIMSVTPEWRCDECGERSRINPHARSLCMTTRTDVEPMNQEKRGKI